MAQVVYVRLMLIIDAVKSGFHVGKGGRQRKRRSLARLKTRYVTSLHLPQPIADRKSYLAWQHALLKCDGLRMSGL